MESIPADSELTDEDLLGRLGRDRYGSCRASRQRSGAAFLTH
jgi:hypothetical protein